MGIGISVVIPTLNREALALTAARDLLAQTHHPLEILVVDQSNRPSNELQRFASESGDRVRYFYVQDFRGLPNARNFGIAKARFEAILFIDDDVRCPPELVAEHAKILTQEKVGIVAGALDETTRKHDSSPRPGKFRFWTATPMHGFSSLGIRDSDHAPGGNFSVWRNVALEVGGFDERLNVGAALYEETEFCLRVRKAGFRIVYNGAARLTHLVSPSAGCREPDVRRYIYGLAHNRAILIRRFLKPYHFPSALARVVGLAAAYTRSSRNLSVIPNALDGFVRGWIEARLPPRNSSRAGKTS